MKPYDQINWKSIIRWGIPTILTLLFLGFLFARLVADYIEMGAVGYAFCNPTLWLLGLDHLMWDASAVHDTSNTLSGAGFFLILLSIVVHIVALVFGIVGLVMLWCHAAEKH